MPIRRLFTNQGGFSAPRRAGVVGVVGLVLGMSPAAAQTCGPQWLPGGAVPGLGGRARGSALWDPDGPGPLAPRLVVAGSFDCAGDTVVHDLAQFDQSGWSGLGVHPNDAFETAYSLTPLPDGRLFATGVSTAQHPRCAAVWDGTHWTTLAGSGVTGQSFASCVLPNGDLVMGGSIAIPGSGYDEHIARWDGTDWRSMDGGLTSGGINHGPYAMVVAPDGGLIVGGYIVKAGGIPVSNVARWNGAHWSAMGGGLGGDVRALCVAPNGDILAGGLFASLGYVARWNGTTWSSLGAGITGGVTAIAVLPGGDIVVGGAFKTAGGSPANNLARWDGTAWHPLGGGLPGTALVDSLTVLPDGSLIATGSFLFADSKPAHMVARWHDGVWSPLNTGTDGPVLASAIAPNGEVVVGGAFRTIEGLDIQGVAGWNGAAWSGIGEGLTSPIPQAASVNSVAFDASGRLYAAGTFQPSPGQPASSVVAWDHESWKPVGQGVANAQFLEAIPDGRVVAAGSSMSIAGKRGAVAFWNGHSWALDSQLGLIRGLAVTPGGQLFVSTSAGVARWNDNGAWVFISRNTLPADSLLPLPDGGLLAGVRDARSFPTVTHLVKWDGTTWINVGDAMSPQSTIRALALLPNGDVVAGGDFDVAGSVSAPGIARFNGTAWQPLDIGVDGTVNMLRTLPSGELLVGGTSKVAGGAVSAFIARWTDTGVPWVGLQPVAHGSLVGSIASLSATPATEYHDVNYQWQRETVPGSGNFANISDGPGGASPGGGTVAGSSGVFASPTNGTPAVLTIAGAQVSDTGVYRLVVTNPCGSASSATATLAIGCSAADITGDGTIDLSDFIAFLGCWDRAAPCADVDGVPGLDLLDFFAFFDAFEAGC